MQFWQHKSHVTQNLTFSELRSRCPLALTATGHFSLFEDKIQVFWPKKYIFSFFKKEQTFYVLVWDEHHKRNLQKKKYLRVVLNILRSASEDEKKYSIKGKDYHCWNARQGAVHLQFHFIYGTFLYSDIFNLKPSDWHCPRAHSSAGCTSLPVEEGDIKLPSQPDIRNPLFLYSFIQPLKQSSRECKQYLHHTNIMQWAKILNQSCTIHGNIYGSFNHPWEEMEDLIVKSHKFQCRNTTQHWEIHRKR